jgi:hypothetical protein
MKHKKNLIKSAKARVTGTIQCLIVSHVHLHLYHLTCLISNFIEKIHLTCLISNFIEKIHLTCLISNFIHNFLNLLSCY